MRSLVGALTLGLGGCQDYAFAPRAEPDGPLPVIAVDPPLLRFDGVSWEAYEESEIHVHNAGEALLVIDGIALEASTAFEVDGPPATAIEPGATQVWSVRFHPVDPADEGTLWFSSNDAARPEVGVDLWGAGRFPRLTLDPPEVEIPSPGVGCPANAEVWLRNIGGADLVVDTLAHAGEGFTLVAPPALPLTLAPGAAYPLEVSFQSERLGGYEGVLHASSNDPSGTATAVQRVEVNPPPQHVEEFRQEGAWEGLRVLFWADGSGSMRDDQGNLAANLGLFTASLDALATPWSIGVLGDDGCRTGDWLTADTPDLETRFLGALQASFGWEAGLGVGVRAMEQLEPESCNHGLLADDVKPLLVLVSDEPEQSGVPWDAQVAAIRTVAPHVMISAIAGDLPTGCPTASAGFGYFEAAAATGGQFLSICGTDWGAKLELIARRAFDGVLWERFPLAGNPDPTTIDVAVAGTAVSGWVYDADDRAIVFAPASAPPPGARVRVTYAEPIVCAP